VQSLCLFHLLNVIDFLAKNAQMDQLISLKMEKELANTYFLQSQTIYGLIVEKLVYIGYLLRFD